MFGVNSLAQAASRSAKTSRGACRNKAIGCPGAVSSEVHLRNARIITPRSCCGTLASCRMRARLCENPGLARARNGQFFGAAGVARGFKSESLRRICLQRCGVVLRRRFGTAWGPAVTMTPTLRPTNSIAMSAARSLRPSVYRYSIAIVRPSTQPGSPSPPAKLATKLPMAAGVV
jgi:hypothetical protein